MGYTTISGSATASGATHVGDGVYAQAGLDQNTALSALALEACTFSFAAGAIDLAADTTHGTIGVYTPGVYCVTGAASIGTAGITLSGAGTHIFRIVGAFTSVVNSHVTLDGASVSDIFWTPTEATTLAANTTFMGTIIDAAGITVGANTIWTGRALAFGGTVTADTNTITVPEATPATPFTHTQKNLNTWVPYGINANVTISTVDGKFHAEGVPAGYTLVYYPDTDAIKRNWL